MLRAGQGQRPVASGLPPHQPPRHWLRLQTPEHRERGQRPSCPKKGTATRLRPVATGLLSCSHSAQAERPRGRRAGRLRSLAVLLCASTAHRLWLRVSCSHSDQLPLDCSYSAQLPLDCSHWAQVLMPRGPGCDLWRRLRPWAQT